jgi:hypothetical protein
MLAPPPRAASKSANFITGRRIYRLTIERLGYESVRLQDTTEQLNKLRQRYQQMQARSAGRTLSVPPRPAKPESTPAAAAPANAAQALTLKATPAMSK